MLNNTDKSKHTVLIVDDDTIFCELVSESLRMKSIMVVSTHTIADAKEALSKHRFDILIIDHHLPDGSGTVLMPVLQELEVKPYILMISADDDLSSMEKGFSSGVHDYLVKPVSLDLLWEKIRNLLSFKQTNIDLANKNELLNKLIDEKSREELLAEYVYRKMINSNQTLPDFLTMKSMPFSKFSGDIVFCPFNPSGKVQIFLADAMGHGLAAAISVLPLFSIARAMASKGKQIDDIFYEINRKLYNEIPDDRFVALLALEFCPHSLTVSIINAGLPPILYCTNDGNITKFHSRAMPLGILHPDDFTVVIEQVGLENLNQIAVFTDGLIEQTDLEGNPVTLEALITETSRLFNDQKSFINLMDYCLKTTNGQPPQDDITLCVINGRQLLSEFSSLSEVPMLTFGEIDYHFSIRGQAMARMDLLGNVMYMLQDAEFPKELCQRAFTVMSELVNNAIDHGVLKLDSSMKDDVEGFAAYFSLREERILELSEKDQINIHIYANSTTFIRVTVEDSGNGFDLSDQKTQHQSLSGRGLTLLEAMCDSVERNKKGNVTTISISRK